LRPLVFHERGAVFLYFVFSIQTPGSKIQELFCLLQVSAVKYLTMKKILYRTFRFTSAVQYGFRTRFTPAGRLVIAALVITAFVGQNTNLNMAFQGFTLLTALLVVAFFTTLFFKPAVTVTRRLPRFGTAGDSFTYRMMVSNNSPKTQKGLTLLEMTPDPRPSFEEFVTSREPLEEKRNIFDRKVGYHRWLWLVGLKQSAGIEEAPMTELGPNTQDEVRIQVIPRRRGRLHLSGVKFARADVFGLYRAVHRIPEYGSVLILPRRYRLPPVLLPGHRKYQPGGVALASTVGDAEEFVSLREYRPGDPLRRIHWKSWAKIGKPIVKEYQEEYFIRHALILDTFHPVTGSQSFEEAVSLAASFASTLETRESLLDLMFVGTEAYCFTSGRGLTQTDRMLEILASAEVCQNRPFSDLYPLVLERAGLLSSCICILLSWDADRQDLVQRLKESGLPVLVLVVLQEGHAETVTPGPMKDDSDRFVVLEAGKIEQGLAKLGHS